MIWVNSRTNDLDRLVQGVKDATLPVTDHGAAIAELDCALTSLQDRLQHIRDYAAAVDALRVTEQISRADR